MSQDDHRERLVGLHAQFRPRAERLLERMVELGRGEPWRPVVVSAFRSPDAQERLFGQGRERIIVRDGDRVISRWRVGGFGRIVTRARAWQSAHCFGLAFDLALVDDRRGDYVSDEHPAWDVLEREARKIDLETGNSWISFRDAPHVQVPHWQRLVEDEITSLRRRYGE